MIALPDKRRLKRFACRVAVWGIKLVLQFVFVISMFILIPIMEGKFYPVVKDIKDVSVQQIADGQIVMFNASKVRPCRFDEIVGLVKVNGYFEKAKVTYIETYDPRAGRETRPIGSQVFGPWKVEPKGTEIILASRHTCNALWDAETQLIHWTQK